MRLPTPLFMCALIVAHPLPSPAASPTRGDDVAELVRIVKRDRDEVDPSIFDRIAAARSPRAVAGLERCAGWLRERQVVARLCDALRTFAGDEKLEPQAVAVLEELCFDADRTRASTALRSLAGWGEPADAAVERVVREHTDPDTRSRACAHVALTWARGGDGERVRLLVDHLRLDPPRRRGRGGRGRSRDRGPVVQVDELREALASAVPGVTPVMVEKLLDRSTVAPWRSLLLEVVVADPDPAVTKALATLTRDGDAALALAALHALGRRSDGAEQLKTIAGNLRSKNPAQRRAAVVALGKLSIDDEEWIERLLELSNKNDHLLRMGACHALADLRTEEALERLAQLLEDDVWQVRAEALWQLASVREKATIPLLIARLSLERGRLREDLARALRLLTGKDFGTLPARWERWWAAEGAGFVVPPLEEVLAAEEPVATVEAGQTSATFYGLRVLSDRVCFILDTSGSMEDPTSSRRGTGVGGRGGPSRIAAAKRELLSALESLPNGDRFNMIFFADRAEAWKRHLTAMADQPRRKASDFVRDREARGGTAVYDALELAFQDEEVDTIYLMTDGEPTVGAVVDPARIRREVAAWNEARRITIHGISAGRDSRLLRGLAEDSGGRYQRID